LTYAYDPAGNRVRTGGSWARTLLPAAVSGGTYDAANRQLALGGKTMTYDFNGNLQTLTESGQTTTYTWDARNRLVALSGPVLTASFAYDATGRRTSKTITGFATTFLYDGLDIASEIAGGSIVNYLRGPGIDEHLARIEETGGTFCYAPDALGSTLALTDTGGGIPTEYTYDPFGTTTTSGAPSGSPFQYGGRENDGAGLYYYRARYYQLQLRRFIHEDPIRLRGGDINLYAYVENDPLNRTDPLGHGFCRWVAKKLASLSIRGTVGSVIGVPLGLELLNPRPLNETQEELEEYRKRKEFERGLEELRRRLGEIGNNVDVLCEILRCPPPKERDNCLC
jgi:RHS repeat-associated protein